MNYKKIRPKIWLSDMIKTSGNRFLVSEDVGDIVVKEYGNICYYINRKGGVENETKQDKQD